LSAETPPLDALVFRPATVADADRLAAVAVEGFETYRVFAPEDFQVPSADEIAGNLATRLETPTVWCMLAEQPSQVAGYVSMLPAADARRPVSDPRLVHFWMLFVRAPWWGTGLATRLHDAACTEAATRGYTAMRLFTPAEQARARRFYEREGWTLAGGPHPDDDLRISIVEYRRALPDGNLRPT
jgi:GNAT superfamily N-acetyltransferase